MKKQLLALAVFGALSAPVFADDSSVNLYGRLEMGIESNDDATTNRLVVQNFMSRIGFKGEEDLNNGLKAVWQIETLISPDEATATAFATRNSYVGLKGSFGTILKGNYDSPFKSLVRNVILLWNQVDATELFILGKVSAAGLGMNANVRQKNVIQYHSPNMSGFLVRASYAPDEAKVKGGTNKQSYAFSGEYDAGMWNVGAAYYVKEDAAIPGKDFSAIKLIAGMKMGNVSLGGAYSKLDNDAGKKTDVFMLAGAYKMGTTTLKASVATAQETASNAKDGADFLALQVDYTMSKHSTLYGYLAQLKNEDLGVAKFESGDNKFAPVAGKDPRVFGVAIRHIF
ncbi:porin [Chitinimonas sp. PSY-7]|uniref:porin n=1 Tax=Chitinimonas sp. PSY-7 TaxID=3459088 RepID=UPI00403FDEB6